MIKWIVQNNLIKPEVLNEFRQAFKELKIDFEEVQVIPFHPDLPIFTPSEINIFYGSTSLLLNVYSNAKFKKGVFYDSDQFTMSNYLNKWTSKMLNSDGRIIRFKEFNDELINTNSEWFIRPNEDDKSFAGTTMSSTEIRDWYLKIKGIDNPSLNPETLIFVSKKKEIRKEWRNFIVNGKVIDSSRYMLNGNLNISNNDSPKEMIEFAEECSAQYSPHDIFVMDLAETANGYKIIECNCFNGTGFYDHHIKTIVEAISARVNTSKLKMLKEN